MKKQLLISAALTLISGVAMAAPVSCDAIFHDQAAFGPSVNAIYVNAKAPADLQTITLKFAAQHTNDVMSQFSFKVNNTENGAVCMKHANASANNLTILGHSAAITDKQVLVMTVNGQKLTYQVKY